MSWRAPPRRSKAAGYETVSLGEHVGDDELERAIGAHHPGAICLNVPARARAGRAAGRRSAASAPVSEPPLVLIRGGEEEDAPGAGTIPITSTEDAIEVLASELAGSERVSPWAGRSRADHIPAERRFRPRIAPHGERSAGAGGTDEDTGDDRGRDGRRGGSIGAMTAGPSRA